MAQGPMKQFELVPYFHFNVAGYNISYTNSAFFMTLAVGVSLLLFLVATRKRTVVPGRWQSVAELLYEFTAGMVNDTVGKDGLRYVPFIFTLFLFILLGNVFGLMPYGFAFTSHIIVNFALAIFIFLAVTVIGFARHGLHYFSLFLPKGTPLLVAPFLVLLEMFGYCIRPFTLSLRLFANMIAGHILLKVLAGFIIAMGLLGGVVPLAAVFAVTLLEIIVALIQAYVFAILACIYLNDAVNLH